MGETAAAGKGADQRTGSKRAAFAAVLLVGLASFVGYHTFGELGRSGDRTLVIWGTSVLLALAAATLGLVTRRWWARWLGLGAGVATTLYGSWFGAALVMDRSRFEPMLLIFATGPLLLASLLGRAMWERFDASAGWGDDARARLVRWTAITNIASLGSLLIVSLVLFSEAGHHRPAAMGVGPSFAATAVLLAGIALLARKKTAGLFAMGVGLVLLTGLFVIFCRDRGLHDKTIVAFLLSAFLPGFATAFAMLVVYARPVWRFLRGGG